MSATDELRERLKELEVQYQACSDSLTMWKHDGKTAIYAEYPEGGKLRAFVTPEQAIAATLGTGTCKVMRVDGFIERIECSECGYRLLDSYYIDISEWNFCPKCGRRMEVDE